MIHEFSTSEVSEILELKVTRIHQWLARGYFRPTMSKAKGSGSRNRFSLDDVYRIALFAKLVSRGYSCEALQSILGLRYSAATAIMNRKKLIFSSQRRGHSIL